MPTKKQARRKAESRNAHQLQQADVKKDRKPLEKLPDVKLPEELVKPKRPPRPPLRERMKPGIERAGTGLRRAGSGIGTGAQRARSGAGAGARALERTATALEAAGRRFEPIVSARLFPQLTLIAMFIASAVSYAIIAHQHVVPNLFPDEMRYGKMSQNLADGTGLTWRGSNQGLPPLWTAILSIAWHFGSIPTGYGVARVITAVLVSSVVFPVWFLGRELAGPRLALIPAALSVLGAWMIVSTFLVSENIAYPLGAAALACIVMAVRDTRARWLWASVGFSVLAAAARTQMLSLLVILVLALIFDVLRQPAGERWERIDARPRYLWIGLVVAVVALLGAFLVKPDLTNYDAFANHSTVAKVASTTGKHFASALLMFAIVPAAVVFAMMTRPRNWRDDTSGPLLVTIAAACLVLFPLLGRFEASATAGSPVDRYGMYLAPLFMVALVVAPGRIGRIAGYGGAALTAVLMFAVPTANNFIEQPAVYGMEQRLFKAGLFTTHLPTGVAIVALPIAAAAVAALTSRRAAALGLSIAVVITGAVLVTQNWTGQAYEINVERQLVPLYGVTKPYDWVDRVAKGPVAMFAIGRGEPLRGNPDLYTDFFNQKVKYLYSTNPQSGSLECQLAFAAHGYLSQSGGDSCVPWPHYYVLLERSVRVTFYGESDLVTRPSGRLVYIPTKQPRVLGLVHPPCTFSDGCTGQLQLGTYTDQPGRMAVTFSASPDRHQIEAGNQVQVLPAGKPATVRFNVPPGDHGFNIAVDWNTPVNAPQVASVYLRTGGKTFRLF